MTTIHLYLDKRSIKAGEEAPLKVGINKRGSSAYIPVGVKILPSQWDKAKERIKEHPRKVSLQSYIDGMKARVQEVVMRLTNEGELANLTATQIKNAVLEILDPNDRKDSFYSRFERYANSRQAPSTKDKYMQTMKHMLEYDTSLKSKSFEDINLDWLHGFDRFLVKYNPAKNGRNIHFRNIRAVFNDAIDNDITTAYPFRKFKIVPEETEKRSLSVKQLREQFTKDDYFSDLFKLSFFLIGINLVDLCHLQEVKNGRIKYKRAKTGKLYDIKVEREALDIINAHRGKSYLLDILDRYKNVHTFTIAFNKHIPFTSYWARHSWATIANDLQIPVDTISRALGHSFSTGAKVTSTYIKFDTSLVDDANRKVMDYVLYNR